MTQKRRSFSSEFKSEAVRLIKDEGYSVSEASRNLGVDYGVLRRWIQKSESAATTGSANLQSEVLVLRKEVKRLRMEREILKKAAAFFARESQ
jgi:transposase